QGGDVSIPTSRIVPTAVLAGGGRRRTTDSLAGADPLRIGAYPLLSALAANDSVSVGLQIPPEMAAASPSQLYELGLTTAATGFHTAAIAALRECTTQAPDHAAAWRKLAELLRLAREDTEAEAADAAAERVSAVADR